MDIPSLEQELLNAHNETSTNTYFDQAYEAYFTSSDSATEEAAQGIHTPSVPASPTSPASTSPQNVTLHVPPIKLEQAPSLSDSVSSPSLNLSNNNVNRRSSTVRKTRRTNKDLSPSDDDDERREKVKNSEKKRRDRLRYVGMGH
jgi:hypothetical protein